MQKVSLLFLTLLFSQVIYSQHLKFRDIPITGNIYDFVDSLEHKGYIKKEAKGDVVTMTGKFVGKEAELFVIATPKTKQVWKVAVYLPEQESWYSLKNDYKKFVNNFQAKYGSPSDHFEFFSKPYYEGDSYELTALKLEKCTYVSYFKVNEGIVSVEISKFCQIKFTYEDNINTQLKQSEEKASVMEDI